MSAISPIDPPGHGGPWLRVVGADGWGRGSLADWAHARPLLEDALAAHIARLTRDRLQRERLAGVLARLGLLGAPPLTLADAGRVAGLSGERVRQIESRLRKLHEGVVFPLPQLDEALAAVARAVPIPASKVGELLCASGLSAGRFSTESLLSAAELLGRRPRFFVSGTGPQAVLLPAVAAAVAAHAPAIEIRARRHVERTGASTVEALAQELADIGILASRCQLRVVLATCMNAKVRSDGWFWFEAPPREGAFLRASRRMLAVTSPLPVESLQDGLRRHNSFRRRPAPPPLAVLAQVYADHPAFEVVDGMVAPVTPLDPCIVGPLNLRMVEILRAAPQGVLPRASLLDACHRAELNLTSVNLYTSYSECLERIGPGLFAARGTAVAGPEATAGRRRARQRPDDGPVCGWTADGRPWLAARVTPSTWANGVVHVPAELRSALGERHFACADGDGTPVTTLGIDQHGNSWGWTGFLRRAEASPGDVVRATFSPETETAVLEVVEEPPATPD